MYNPTITVKSKDVEERSVYLTYLRDKEKNEVRMCKMDNEEQLEHGLFLLLDNLEPHERLRAFYGLAKVWKQHVDKDEESEVAMAIARFVGNYCYICGEHCREVVDEKHDESYIVCQTGGGFRSTYLDTAFEKGEQCPNYGWDSISIKFFLEENDKKEYDNLLKEQTEYHKKRGRVF